MQIYLQFSSTCSKYPPSAGTLLGVVHATVVSVNDVAVAFVSNDVSNTQK